MTTSSFTEVLISRNTKLKLSNRKKLYTVAVDLLMLATAVTDALMLAVAAAVMLSLAQH